MNSKESNLKSLYNAKMRAYINKGTDPVSLKDLDVLEREFHKEFNKVEKSLEILEIIKKYIYVSKPFGSACYIKLNDESELIPEKEYNLLKEWLENE